MDYKGQQSNPFLWTAALCTPKKSAASPNLRLEHRIAVPNGRAAGGGRAAERRRALRKERVCRRRPLPRPAGRRGRSIAGAHARRAGVDEDSAPAREGCVDAAGALGCGLSRHGGE